MGGRPWNEREITFVKAHFLDQTCKEIAAGLPGRTKRAVEHLARHLGLSRPEPAIGDKFTRLEIVGAKEYVQKYGQ